MNSLILYTIIRAVDSGAVAPPGILRSAKLLICTCPIRCGQAEAFRENSELHCASGNLPSSSYPVLVALSWFHSKLEVAILRGYEITVDLVKIFSCYLPPLQT